MIERFVKNIIDAYLTTFRVVMVVGARQAGKSTLVQQIAQEKGFIYRTFDDAIELSNAAVDPQSYIDYIAKPVVIDEVQRLPEVLLPIKRDVDTHTDKGRYFLTGSANVMQLPTVADSLAGRMGVIQMFPLAQAEIEGVQNTFVDMLFSDALPLYHYQPISQTEVVQRLLQGGYPEVGSLAEAHRQLWFDSYTNTLIQRDVRDVAKIEGITEIPRLLTLIALRTSTLLNTASLSRDIDMPTTTLRRYLSLLETIHLVDILPSWQRNFGKRLVKSPKVSLTDTGIIAALMGIDAEYLERNRTFLGQMLESFALAELRKLASWSTHHSRLSFYHYRSSSQREVDILLELANRSLVGIEVKLSQSISLKDFAGLVELRDTIDHFHRGIVLYHGTEIRTFADKLYAVPLQALWQKPQTSTV